MASRLRAVGSIVELVRIQTGGGDVEGGFLGCLLFPGFLGLGPGLLDLLLPPARIDLSEICIYSSGLVQVMKKNSVRWETLPDIHPDPFEVIRVLDRILGPQNKSLNEANPTVNAKLPATPYNPGGGRIKALHPVVAPPGRNPSINICLFEQKPVLPEWILARQMMSPEMMAILQNCEYWSVQRIKSPPLWQQKSLPVLVAKTFYMERR